MNSTKRCTIHDIARQLNISASTVSRALNDHPRISQQMRIAVHDLARELNYHPDFRGLSLRSGSGRTLGVLVPQVDRYFFATVLRGIDDVATEHGYDVLICQSYESIAKETALVTSLLNGKVDGLIASVSIETTDDHHFRQLMKKNIPLVFFDRPLDTLNVSKVLIDDFKGSVDAVEHLIAGGRRKIAHFAGPQHIRVYKDRTAGYLHALKQHHLEVIKDLIIPNTITQQTGYRSMKSILAMTPRPDAIFSSGDYSALGALLFAREAGLSVPDEISIAGFANEPFCPLVNPPLTSVDQQAQEMGRQAAILLIKEILRKEKHPIPSTVVLEPRLIIRESSHRLFEPFP